MTPIASPAIEPTSAPISLKKRALRMPRLGFLGAGWIGRARMQAIAQSGLAEVTAVADPLSEALRQVQTEFPAVTTVDGLQSLLSRDLDAVVIATPSAMHAEQTVAALERGMAVFCQKPLGRNARETRQVVAAARKADRLLGVDLSYRHMAAVRALRQVVQEGQLGQIFAAELSFHNAYGPDKTWFYDPRLSGGGCVIDLGIHLADLALWMLDFPQVTRVDARLFKGGLPLPVGSDVVEDYAEARVDLNTGATIRLACSWKLHAGRDALIHGSFFGTRGGASFHNVNGSFYDFVAEKFSGTRTQTLAEGPDAWGGRAAVDWVEQLLEAPQFRPEAEHLIQVAEVLDDIMASGKAF